MAERKVRLEVRAWAAGASVASRLGAVVVEKAESGVTVVGSADDGGGGAGASVGAGAADVFGLLDSNLEATGEQKSMQLRLKL